ncbi:MAG: transglycosylase SLT domain-containing protein [Hydrogenophaga sp.]|nr:transglycosylase SLT domain-containing protein [Hydrogenophaga sp.]
MMGCVGKWRTFDAAGLRAGLAACVCFYLTVAHAQVWTYTDADGLVQFSNQRPSDRQAMLISGGPESRDIKQEGAAVGEGVQRSLAQIDSSPRYHAIREQLDQAAQEHGVEVELIKAVVAAESAFNSEAVSPKGAVGLMQVMPATARRFGVSAATGHTVERQLRDPRTNVQTGTRYLAYLLQLFDGELELALAAYNAGEGAVIRSGRQIPNYRETRDYVAKVLGLYNGWRARR